MDVSTQTAEELVNLFHEECGCAVSVLPQEDGLLFKFRTPCGPLLEIPGTALRSLTAEAIYAELDRQHWKRFLAAGLAPGEEFVFDGKRLLHKGFERISRLIAKAYEDVPLEEGMAEIEALCAEVRAGR